MNIEDLINQSEEEVREQYRIAEEICEFNSKKVLDAFHNNNISEIHFGSTTGYGTNDIGRDKIEDMYCDIFKCEAALVRNQFISGTHALTVALFSMLRPGETMLSINGKPYDTLEEVIGIRENKSSLKSYGIGYEQIDLIDNDFDYKKIKATLKEKKFKLIEIQRSRGYALRKSISIEKVKKVIEEIRKVDQEVIIMVDNCYCEFVGKQEPTEVGADIVVGSLIKNLGAGIAPNGAYIVGRKDLIELAGERLTVPGEGCEVGPTLGINKSFLQGLFFAPSVVCSSIKTAILTSRVLGKLGYKVDPMYDDIRTDIVQTIEFGNPDDLIKYCQGIQAGSPIDSNSVPEPSDMPGYSDQIIMASGSFNQGSSIELSCDGPLRTPFVGFQQGGLTYEYGKLGLISAVKKLKGE